MTWRYACMYNVWQYTPRSFAVCTCSHCRFLLGFAPLPGCSSCQLPNWALIMLEAALHFGSCIVVGGTKCQQQAHEPWQFAFEALVQSKHSFGKQCSC